jgi:hypothetical protein
MEPGFCIGSIYFFPDCRQLKKLNCRAKMKISDKNLVYSHILKTN